MLYTIKTVPRINADGYAYLVLRVDWDQKRDTFSFVVDGNRYEWYRRGAPMFDTWTAGCEYVRRHGWPLND